MLIDDMAEMGGITNRASIMAFMELQKRAIIKRLEEGDRVETGTGTYELKIKGSFEGAEDSFSPERHVLLLRTTPGAELGKLLTELKTPEKLRPGDGLPILDSVYDYITKQKNDTLHIGEPALLRGQKLHFDETDPNLGIFFIHLETLEATRVKRFMEHGPIVLRFKVPATLTPGRYYLEVRTGLDDQGNMLMARLKYALTLAVDPE
jgi:hypothetical protein